MATKWLLHFQALCLHSKQEEGKGDGHIKSERKAFPEIPRRSLLIGPNSTAWPCLTARAPGKCSFLKLFLCPPDQTGILLGRGEWILVDNWLLLPHTLWGETVSGWIRP